MNPQTPFNNYEPPNARPPCPLTKQNTRGRVDKRRVALELPIREEHVHAAEDRLQLVLRDELLHAPPGGLHQDLIPATPWPPSRLTNGRSVLGY